MTQQLGQLFGIVLICHTTKSSDMKQPWLFLSFPQLIEAKTQVLTQFSNKYVITI